MNGHMGESEIKSTSCHVHTRSLPSTTPCLSGGSEDLDTFRQQTEAWHSDTVFYTTSKIQRVEMPESKFLRGIESKSVFLYSALPLILSAVPPTCKPF